jgi:hypothetical protein
MVTVCAWCHRYLGIKDPRSEITISHGICPTCAARQQLQGAPTLVISRKWARALPIMQDLLRGTPGIPVVLDRRREDRRRESRSHPKDRRRLKDRRQNEGMALV